jgi:hypothetical protein
MVILFEGQRLLVGTLVAFAESYTFFRHVIFDS